MKAIFAMVCFAAWFTCPAWSQPSNVVSIVVNADLKPLIQSHLDRYVTDIETDGFYHPILKAWDMTAPDHTTASNLRGYLGTVDNLVGAVFVGDLPIQHYQNTDDFNGNTATFPFDLFFMDLEVTWEFSNGWVVGSSPSDINPRIWVSRIKGSNMGGAFPDQGEAVLVKTYFDKNHAFRTGALRLPDRALMWADNDWASYRGRLAVGHAYADTTWVTVNEPGIVTTDRADWVSRWNTPYETEFFMCHSSATRHYPGVSPVYSAEVAAADIRRLFWNCWNCTSARYTVANFIAGVRLFTPNYGLVVVGTTKTGSMQEAQDFYAFLNEGKSHGQAFKEWFARYWGPSVTNLRWHRGMTLLGDGTLRLGRFHPFVEKPVFTPDGGAYTEDVVEVMIESATSGAVIRYTVDGRDPEETDATIDSGGVLSVTVPAVLKARAWKDGHDPSEISSTTQYRIRSVMPGQTQGDESFVLSGSETEYVVHRYTTADESLFVPPEGVDAVEYLIVAGGGGGGCLQNNTTTGAGAGGAGGLLTNVGEAKLLLSEPSYQVVVGGGGAGATVHATDGSNGSASSAFGLTAVGGGGGGGNHTIGDNRAGQSGGSGGGGGYLANKANTGGAAEEGQGHKGGDGYNVTGGGGAGGGGGAATPGQIGTASAAGYGGEGREINITGTPFFYGGGGGGGGADKAQAGSGGVGGGGAGGIRSGASAYHGVNGLGGGGGGGAANSSSSSPGGDGGSGIVVIRYAAPREFTHTARGVSIAWYQRQGFSPSPDNDWHALDLVDSDGDGFLNWQEYIADTDPMDPDNHFPPVGIEGAGAGFEVVIDPTSVARQYHIDSAACLIDSAWTNRFSAPGTGGRWSWSPPASPAAVNYYRSRVTLPEE